MSITVDASDIFQMAAGFAQGPTIVREELVTTTNALAITGIGLAQEFAPVRDGWLRASIHLIQAASLRGTTVVARYGTGIIYARIQEEGGVIVPRTKKFLSWIGSDGQRVFAKRVKIPARKYMQKSRDALEPMAQAAYGKAADRIAARLEAAI